LQPPKSGKGSAKSPKSNKREKERQKKEEAEQKAAAEGNHYTLPVLVASQIN